MKPLFMLLLAAIALLLAGCGYWAVEVPSVQVGDAVHFVTQAPEYDNHGY